MKSLHLPILFARAVAATGIQGAGAGPSDQLETFTSANQHPNATGVYPIFGVDMSIPPSQIFTKTWDASINVTEVTITANSESSTQANTVLALNANGNYLFNDTNWGTCAVVMLDVTEEATKNGLNAPDGGNGNCTSVLGADCVSDWLQALRNARGIAGRNSRNANTTLACSGLSIPSVPASCEGKFTLNTYASNIDRNYSEGNGFFYQTTDSYDPANKTSQEVYNAAATRIWPVVLMQGATYNFNRGGGLTFAQMVCLRANMTADGSREVGDVPGIGARFHGSIFAALGSLTAAALLI